MENKVSTFNTAARYGLFAGLILIVWSLVSMMIFSQPGVIATLLNIFVPAIVIIGASVLVINFHRDKELGGYITFTKAFVVSILAIVIAGAILAVYSSINVAIINPDFFEAQLNEMAIDFEDAGMTDQAIDATMSLMESITSPLGILFIVLFFYAFIGAIISLITALVLKSEDPNPDF